jgi:vacuolar protein sorting-associated protein 54
MGDWKQARLVRAAEVRLVIEQIIGGLQGSFAAAAVAAAFASGAAAAAAAEAAQESQTGSSSSSSLTRANSMSISQQFRVDVLRENTEAVCATCDAAHGRWAKLLGVRALIHPKLRLQEFVGIYEITQEFISATEKVSARICKLVCAHLLDLSCNYQGSCSVFLCLVTALSVVLSLLA